MSRLALEQRLQIVQIFNGSVETIAQSSLYFEKLRTSFISGVLQRISLFFTRRTVRNYRRRSEQAQPLLPTTIEAVAIHFMEDLSEGSGLANL